MVLASTPTVFFATRFFGASPVEVLRLADNDALRVITDRRQLRLADAVVFHIPELSFRRTFDLPKYRGQLWVAWSMESAINYRRLTSADFMQHFDLEMTYRRNADVWTPYLPGIDAWRAAQLVPIPAKEEHAPMTMFQSAANDSSGRIAYATELMRHIRVDSYGRVLHTRDLPGDAGASSKRAAIAGYRFCLSLENAIEPDYVTEKLFDPLMAGTVPVYRGAPNAAEFAPPRSFVDATQFGSPKALADYLHYLCERPEEYLSYLTWRHRPLPPRLLEMIARVERSTGLRLAEAVTAHKRRPNGWQHYYPFGLREKLRAMVVRAKP